MSHDSRARGGLGSGVVKGILRKSGTRGDVGAGGSGVGQGPMGTTTTVSGGQGTQDGIGPDGLRVVNK